MSPPKSRQMARFSHVLPLFPQNCLSAFQQLAILWSGLVRLSFHSLKRQVPIRVNGVDLLDVFLFHAHDTPFAKAFKPLIELMANPALTFPPAFSCFPPLPSPPHPFPLP